MSGDFSELLSLPHTDAEQEWLRERLETLSAKERVILRAVLSWEELETAEDAVNLLMLVGNDNYDFYCPVTNYADLGRCYLGEKRTNLTDSPKRLAELEALGRFFEQDSPGKFVEDCYVLHPRSIMLQLYSRRNPEELNDGWNIRVKLASESCPEGVWIHLPDYPFTQGGSPDEIGIALRRLGVEDVGACRIMDARCNVPGVGDIPAQYDSAEALLNDANNLGFILTGKDKEAPDFEERFAAALEYENCATLAEAVSIGNDVSSYGIVKIENLREFAGKELRHSGVPPKMRKNINLAEYGERLLLDRGYRKNRDGRLFIGRLDHATERNVRGLTPGKAEGTGVVSTGFDELLSLPHTEAQGIWLRMRLERLSVRESAVLTALLSWKAPKTAADVLNLLLNVGQCEVYSPVSNHADLGKRYLKEEGVTLPDSAEKFTDMEALGRICEQKFPGKFVDDCYVLRPRHPLWEPYSGENQVPDEGWNIRVKLESDFCPEGAWIHFPDYNFVEEEMSGEIGIALRWLGVEDMSECRIMDAQCDVPGVGDIPAQYDSVEALLYDANNMGFLLEERGQGAVDFRETFTAALKYENCATLAEAVSIGDDLSSYDIVKAENLPEFAGKELENSGVPTEIRKAVNLEQYGRRLLLDRGYRDSQYGTLFVGRPDRAAERGVRQPTPEKRKKAQPAR